MKCISILHTSIEPLNALASHTVKIGTARETFVVNQLTCDNKVEFGKKSGDFKDNGKYIL